MEGFLALVVLFFSLLLAPLVLGSQVVLEGAGRWQAMVWVGFLCALAVGALLAGAAALWLLVG